MKKIFCIGLFLCGLALVMKAGDSLTFLPHWHAQAQFLGYYVAKEKGFYAKKDLDVKILSSRIAKRVNDELSTQSVDVFTLPLLSAVSLHKEERPLKCLAQFSQANGQLFFARKSSGIETLQDFREKRIGIFHHEVGLMPFLFLENKGIKADVVPIGQNIHLFMRGGLDVMAGSYYNEYDLLRMYGLHSDSIQTFFLAGYGWNIPEDGLYCQAADYQQSPSKYRRFAQASIEGWEYAFSHPEEALKILEKWMKKDNIPFQYAHQQWMLKTLKQLFNSREGKLNPLLRWSDFLQACRVMNIPEARAQNEYNTFCPQR